MPDKTDIRTPELHKNIAGKHFYVYRKNNFFYAADFMLFHHGFQYEEEYYQNYYRDSDGINKKLFFRFFVFFFSSDFTFGLSHNIKFYPVIKKSPFIKKA